MRQGNKVGWGVALLVLAGGIAATLALTLGGGGHHASGLDPASTTRLETALNSGVPTQVVSAIAAQDVATFDPPAAGRLASLHLNIKSSTFRQYDGYATVEASTTSGTWLLTLVREAGLWKLSDTTKVS